MSVEIPFGQPDNTPEWLRRETEAINEYPVLLREDYETDEAWAQDYTLQKKQLRDAYVDDNAVVVETFAAIHYKNLDNLAYLEDAQLIDVLRLAELEYDQNAIAFRHRYTQREQQSRVEAPAGYDDQVMQSPVAIDPLKWVSFNKETRQLICGTRLPQHVQTLSGDIVKLAGVDADVAREQLLDTMRGESIDTALNTISRYLDIDASGMSPASVMHFVDYLAKADHQQFYRLTEAVLHIKDSDKERQQVMRETLTSAFLATEFGDDLGDIVLDLVNTTRPAELHPILSNIGRIREAGSDISYLLRDNPVIQGALSTAFIKRTTELLALGLRDGIGAIEKPLTDLTTVIETISQGVYYDAFTVNQVVIDKNNSDNNFGTVSANNTELSITARPNGHNARVGFTVKLQGEQRKERVSVRLDYEDGGLSLDIGSIANKHTISPADQRIGQALTDGERALLDYRQAAQPGKYDDYKTQANHVREAFSDVPQLEPAEFSRLVHKIMYQLTVL